MAFLSKSLTSEDFQGKRFDFLKTNNEHFKRCKERLWENYCKLKVGQTLKKRYQNPNEKE